MLTLNDEQEKALREWWRYFRPEDYPTCVRPSQDLYAAIAPLMKPWRVEHVELVVTIVGPNGIVLTLDRDFGGYGRAAEKICRVLNGEERWS